MTGTKDQLYFYVLHRSTIHGQVRLQKMAGDLRDHMCCVVLVVQIPIFSVCDCSGGHHRVVLRLCFGVTIWILAGRRLFPPKRARGWSEHSGVAWCLVERALGVPKGAVRQVPRWHTEGRCTHAMSTCVYYVYVRTNSSMRPRLTECECVCANLCVRVTDRVGVESCWYVRGMHGKLVSAWRSAP